MYQYAGEVKQVWDLGDNVGDASAMKAAISDLDPMEGPRNLYTAMNSIFDTELAHGHKGRRTHVPLVLVLITDGRAEVARLSISTSS